MSASNSLAALAADIRAEHEAVQRNSLESAQHAYNAGERLAYARGWRPDGQDPDPDDPVVPFGEWDRWLEEVAGVPKVTAWVYQQIFDAVSNGRTTLNDVAGMGLNGSLTAIRRGIKRLDQQDATYDLPILPAGKFGTIVIDPRWDMQKIEREGADEAKARDDIPFGGWMRSLSRCSAHP
jgi:hypothetical protein